MFPFFHTIKNFIVLSLKVVIFMSDFCKNNILTNIHSIHTLQCILYIEIVILIILFLISYIMFYTFSLYKQN